MAEMAVELVAVERRLWSGKASFVFARTTVGEIGILPGHEQLLTWVVSASMDYTGKIWDVASRKGTSYIERPR